MMKQVHELPTILTSFAYREEYFAEMEGMLVTAREHHPNWLIVAGRGPVPGFDLPTLEVESPSGKCQWSLPVRIDLDGTDGDWRRICMMKAWWVEQVWNNFGDLIKDRNRVLWSDADNRFNGPLDIALEPDGDVIAGADWYHANTIAAGLLLFQGSRRGAVERIIAQWSAKCLGQIQNLPAGTKGWAEGDTEIFSEILLSNPDSSGEYTLIKLDKEKYVGYPTDENDKRVAKALVDHWCMSGRMESSDRHHLNWPPPEEFRQNAEVGEPVPNVNWTPEDY